MSNSKFVPGMQVVAYADLEEAKATEFLDRFGGEYATSDPYRVITDDSLDAVLIQTGPESHPVLGIAAAQAGKHIFVEKPVALTMAEADKLTEAVKKNSVKCLVGFCNRLAPMVLRAKRLLPHPLYSFCQCSDSITGQACHNLDLAVHLFHETRLVSVYASGGSFYHCDPHLAVDSFSAVLHFADDSTHTYLQHGASYNTLLGKYNYQLFGVDTHVWLAKRFKECHYFVGKELVQSLIFDAPDFSPPFISPHTKDVRGPYGYMGHYEELVALCDAIRSDTEPPITIEQGRFVLSIEKSIVESAQTGQVIKIQ